VFHNINTSVYMTTGFSTLIKHHTNEVDFLLSHSYQLLMM